MDNIGGNNVLSVFQLKTIRYSNMLMLSREELHSLMSVGDMDLTLQKIILQSIMFYVPLS